MELGNIMKIMSLKKWSLLVVCIAMVGCRQTVNKSEAVENEMEDTAKVSLKYAEGFSVEYRDGYKLLEISDPQKKDTVNRKTYRFALVNRGEKPKGIPQGYQKIEVPVRGIICMTSLQLSGFIKLDALDYIVGINSSRRLFDKDIKKRIRDGKIVTIGKEGNFDEELIMAANPNAIFVSLTKRGGFDKMEEVGIPLVPYLGYQETTPLAQAEWIKFIGLFTGKTSAANRQFAEMEKSYEDACALVKNAEKEKGNAFRRPVVLYGKLHGSNWYAMAGDSYIAQIFKDAGADYFMKDDGRTGGLYIDFETVYAQAGRCDFWVIQNKDAHPLGYASLKSEDPRYTDFRAWKDRGVVSCETGKTPVNELSPMEPDRVLKDFIQAFHPGLLKDYQPKYYMLLKR